MIEKLETDAMYKENTLGRQLFEMSQKINELCDWANAADLLIERRLSDLQEAVNKLTEPSPTQLKNNDLLTEVRRNHLV